MPDSDSCALHADGTLKDASEITFFHDPDDTVPLPTPLSVKPDAFTMLLESGRKPVPLTAGSWRSGRTSKPSAHLRDTDNVCSTSRTRTLSSATEQLVQKKVVLQLSESSTSSDDDVPHVPNADADNDAGPLETGVDQSEGPLETGVDQSEGPLETGVDQSECDDEREDVDVQITLSKSERTADVRTIFSRHGAYWVCNPCKYVYSNTSSASC